MYNSCAIVIEQFFVILNNNNNKNKKKHLTVLLKNICDRDIIYVLISN